MSEYLSIGVRTTPPLSVACQIHGTAHVIIMKSVAGTAFGPGFSVVRAEDELIRTIDGTDFAVPGPRMIVLAIGCVLNDFRGIGKIIILVY